ncbi:MAG TPA: APC family permease [Candidatus Enterocloster excrementipullorum]|uniref:APC family permease n=1 Tax=Candidatus Enterocloster excrementipullorum TaxID=2838559 RepID=A0A9D2N0D9_9FIRM|nr:APC family permease [Candidatus Enterocloster excrementipullorum]
MSNKQELNKSLTAVNGWAISTGGMIGISIFMISGQISGIAGPAACLGFALAALVVIIIALCISEISSACTKAGGANVHPQFALGGKAGDFLSFFSGWAMWGSQGLGPAIIAIICASYLAKILSLFGIIVPIPDNIMAVIIILILTVLNSRGGEGSKAFQLITTIGIIGAMLIFVFGSLTHAKPELLVDFMPNGPKSVLQAASICILSYGGWSTIPAMAEEFKNPGKDIPKAIISSIITCGLLYTIFCYAMNAQLPGSILAQSTSPPVDAALQFTSWGALLISVAGLLACLSTVNGWIVTGPRVFFSMGRDGVIPKVFGKVSDNGVPGVALWVTSIGQCLLALTGMVQLLIPMVTFVLMISWGISLISMFFLRYKHPETKAPFRAPGFPLVLIVALAALVYMMSLLDSTAVMAGCVWQVVGVVLYYLFKYSSLHKLCE